MFEKRAAINHLLTEEQQEYYRYHGYSQEMLDFCRAQEVMPPPMWSPTGGSGQWDWDKSAPRAAKEERGRSGAWVWNADYIEVKSDKESRPHKSKSLFEKIFRCSFSNEKKKS